MKCSLCSLHKDSSVNFIQGVGPQPSTILFVGEGPGESEEETKRPFTGPAGQLFDRLLEQAGLHRDSVRVTNIVRCRPVDKENRRVDRRGVIHFGNRPPTLQEAYICAPTYLESEILATRPNVIVPLGNTALHYLVGEYEAKSFTQETDGTYVPVLEKKISKIANIMAEAGVERFSEKYKCKIIPAIHPSALLRDPRHINATIETFRRVKATSDNPIATPKIPVNYEMIDTWERVLWALDNLKQSKKFSFDWETTGFDYIRDKLICLGFSWKIGTGVSIRWLAEDGSQIWTEEQKKYFISEINKLFLDESIKKVGFNVKFDIHHSLPKDHILPDLHRIEPDTDKLTKLIGEQYKVLREEGFVFPRPVYDVMLKHHLLDSESSHGLKELSWTFTDMGGYEDELHKEFAGQSRMEKNFLKVPRDKMGWYNSGDCDCTLRIDDVLEERLKQYPKMKWFYETWMSEFIENVIMIERAGAPIDFESIQDMFKRMGERRKEINNTFQTELQLKDFNLNSTIQARKIFFEKLALKPTLMGKSGPSLSKEAVKLLKRDYPDNKFLALLIEYRSLGSDMSKYLKGMKNAALFGRAAVPAKIKDKCWFPKDAIDAGIITDGKVHCDYLLHGTATGRLSSRNPNLQNIKRASPEDRARGFVIRSNFRAWPGWKLLAIDLSSAELWVLQALSGDVALKEALESPEGVHLRFASRLFHVPPAAINSEQKAIAKTVVFGIAYGRQADSIAEQFNIPLAVAQSYVDGFLNTFLGAAAWMKRTVEDAKKNKFVTSVFGRIRWLPGIDSPDYKTRLEAEHQAVNFPIQSAASDITQIAGARARKEITRLGLKSRPIMTTHDENMYHTPIEEVEAMSKIAHESMEAFVPELGIFMKAKLEIFERWKIDEVEEAEDTIREKLQDDVLVPDESEEDESEKEAVNV